MGFKEAIGAIIAGVVILLPAIKWLINDWAKKAEELELLKNKNTEKALSRLNDELRDFRATVNSIQVTIRALEVNMAASKSEMNMLKEQLKAAVKTIEQYAKDFDSKIGNRIKTELVELSKRATLIRNKKQNGE